MKEKFQKVFKKAMSSKDDSQKNTLLTIILSMGKHQPAVSMDSLKRRSVIPYKIYNPDERGQH
jgi:hypothetical protein